MRNSARYNPSPRAGARDTVITSPWSARARASAVVRSRNSSTIEPDMATPLASRARIPAPPESSRRPDPPTMAPPLPPRCRIAPRPLPVEEEGHRVAAIARGDDRPAGHQPQLAPGGVEDAGDLVAAER